MKRTLLLLAVFISLCNQISFAQAKKTVTGTVRNASGEGIPGVTVTEKGTSNGAISQADGSYRLSVAPNATLVFNYIGFLRQEVRTGESASYNITLQEDVTGLDEVVVTGLNIPRARKALGYSQGTVKAEQLENIGSSVNAFSALYGQVAGLKITGTALGPAGGISINVRNAVALTEQSSTRPLIVIDGIPMVDGPTEINRSTGNGLNDLNMDDIATFDVLKGAKAAVLYGSQGANGVILITTKSGAKKKGFGVDVNLSNSMDRVWIMQEFQNEFGSGFPAAWVNPGVVDGEGFYQRFGKQAYYPTNYNFGPKMDGRQILWYDSVMRPYAPQPDNIRKFYRNGNTSTANVSLQGGGENGGFRVSYTRKDYKGIFEGFKLHDNNFTFNGNIKITNRVNFKLVSTYANTFNHNSPPTNQDVFVTYGVPRQLDVDLLRTQIVDHANDDYFWWAMDNRQSRYPTGGIVREGLAGNYFWNQMQNDYDNTRNHFINSATIDVDIAKGLKFQLLGGFDWITNKNEQKEKLRRPLAMGEGGKYYLYNSTDVYYNGQALLNYEKQLNPNFSLNAFVGGVIQKRTSDWTSRTTRNGFITRDWFSFKNSKNTPTESDGFRRYSLLYGAFGSVQIGFKEWLYLELQGRNDWSSILPPANNSYFYPGASVSWLFSEQLKMPSWVSFGKFRIAWADVGRPGPEYFSNNVYDISNYGGVITYAPRDARPPEDLKPERKREVELGLETKFLNNRLGLEVNYYNGNTYDQIMGLSVSPSSGYNSTRINAGQISNKGIEVFINATPLKTADFNWNTVLNFHSDKPKVKKLAQGITSQNLWGMSGAKVVAVEGQPWGQVVVRPYKVNENGVRITEAGYYSTDPTKEEVIGKVLPDIAGGFNNTIAYKGFSLDFNIDYQFGSTLVSQTNMYMVGNGSAASTTAYRDEAHGGLPYYINNNSTLVLLPSHTSPVPGDSKYPFIMHDGVILPGVDADGKQNETIITAADKHSYYWQTFMDIQPDIVYKNDYIKLRNIVLTYELPKKTIGRIGFERLAVSLFANNLWYIYKTMPNVDAEALNGTNVFYENNAFPTTRSYGASIRASF
ncbi:SusC/RagA family TonB-linked outer membrane protein [Chitinophaga sp. YIM B06452]|uniref:SusC/RagA family TonB-linked outer membrane protein n=1 Tax=Chitinophaga sp. YIM B06452 TaxID=3082158 RepID=UPI0031FEC49F